MNTDTIFVIDSFLSTSERADACLKLIYQIRECYPGYKILLINKHKVSWDLIQYVDYYYYHGDRLVIEKPPTDIVKSGKYERPYIYFQTDHGTLENWLPLINVSDHVGDVYNSFIISSSIAKTLGFSKIFKIEYDTYFDEGEFISLKNDIETFEDYLIFGKRKEGTWAKEHQYLIDVHMIGYSTRLFDNYEILKEEKDFWDLCQKINYWGKWIEYIIPTIIQQEIENKSIKGISYSSRVSLMYPNTSFDLISSPGIWSTTWDEIPKICRVSNVSGNHHALPNQIVLFYIGKKKFISGETCVNVKCKITKINNGEIIYEKENLIYPNSWTFDQIFFFEKIKIDVERTSVKGFFKDTYVLSPDDLDLLDARFVFND